MKLCIYIQVIHGLLERLRYSVNEFVKCMLNKRIIEECCDGAKCKGVSAWDYTCKVE